MCKFLRSLVLPCLLFLLPGSAGAFSGQSLVQSDLIWVHPGSSSVFIPFVELGKNDGVTGGEWAKARDAAHGDVVLVEEGFLYTPRGTFWDLETDQFSYRRTVDGRSGTATVRLMRWMPQELVFSTGFEGGAPPGSTYDGAVTFVPEAALVGEAGLRALSVTGDDSALWAADVGGDTSDDGSSTLLGGGFGQFPLALDGEWNRAAIFLLNRAGNGPDEASVRVVLERSTGLPQLRVEVRSLVNPTQFVSSKSIEVERDVVSLGVQWWEDGALLEVDGKTAGIFGVPVFGQFGAVVQVGLAPLFSGIAESARLDFDELRVYQDGEGPEEPTILLGEDFEAGGVPPWATNVGSGLMASALGVTGAGSLGLDLDQGSSFLVGDELRATSRLGLRLRLDADAATLGPGEVLRLVDFGSTADAVSGLPDINLRLAGGANGELALGAVNRNGKLLATTPWFVLSGEHLVELQLRTSASARVKTGLLRLWIDGEVAAEVDLLENNTQRIGWVRLGALGVDAGSGGWIFLDDFDVWH